MSIDELQAIWTTDHHEDEDLLIEELVPHSQEGDGHWTTKPTPKEEDEVQGQLVHC